MNALIGISFTVTLVVIAFCIFGLSMYFIAHKWLKLI